MIIEQLISSMDEALGVVSGEPQFKEKVMKVLDNSKVSGFLSSDDAKSLMCLGLPIVSVTSETSGTDVNKVCKIIFSGKLPYEDLLIILGFTFSDWSRRGIINTTP
ncbi:MAG: hypothetical protein M0R37_12405 [Bacteroidales bacterium]|nr:hypothetical protein [Bacteroidales bacterium]